MLIAGKLLNPAVRSLLARVRHTNRLVIADRGFPSWPKIETIDLSLVDDVPTVLQVLAALKTEWTFGRSYMAEEFLETNPGPITTAFRLALSASETIYEAHVDFKKRVPGSIGLIRTGDTTQYANLILESA